MSSEEHAASLDARASAPASLREAYKYYQRLDGCQLDEDLNVLDWTRGPTDAQWRTVQHRGSVSASAVERACECLGVFGDDAGLDGVGRLRPPSDRPIYESTIVPGQLRRRLSMLRHDSAH